MLKRLILILIILVGAYHTLSNSPLEHSDGELVSEQPSQSGDDLPPPFFHKSYQITPLANFSIKARILAAERYWLGQESELSPIDLALGWGPMSDSAVLDRIDISQSSRFYFWSTQQPPIPLEAIARHSANMHMVPAEPYIEQRLLELRTGDIVALGGYLVRIDAPDGWHWVSSLRRDDSGAGACELVWVRELSVLTATI